MSSVPEPAGPDPRAQVVARNSIWLTLDSLVAIPVSLALSILVARSIGPDVLGLYNFANWILGAGVVVVTNGVTYGMQLFTAEKLGQGDVAGATAVLARGLRWQLGLSAVLVSVGIALTLALSPPQFRVALIVAVASIAPAILVSVPAAGIGAAQAFAANALPSMVAVMVNLVASVVALVAGCGLTGLTAALLVSRAVDLTLRYASWRRVWRVVGAAAHGTEQPGEANLDVPRLRRFAWKSSVLLLLDMIVWDRSEFLVLTRFSPLREVAFYSLSFNVVQQTLVLPRLFAKALAANLLVERGRDPQSVVRLSRDAMRYVFLVAAPLTLGLAAIDRAIMPLLYGPQYAEAIPVIAVVASFAALRGALVPVQALLCMTEQQSFLIGFSVVMGVVNIGLDLWLIPTGGAIGAAWANGLAQTLAMAGLTLFASRKLGLSVPLGDMGRALLACVPMVVLVRAIAASSHHWSAVLFGVPLGAIVYVIGIKLLRVLRPVDEVRLASVNRVFPAALRPAYHRALAWLIAPGVSP